MRRLLTSQLEALVGCEVSYTAPEALGQASIRYFAQAIADDNPLYRDQSAARRAGYDDVIAPPTLVCESNQYMDGTPDNDGYIGHSWDINIPGTRHLRGGHEYEFFQVVKPQDRITATWRLAEMSEGKTRDDRALLFVISEVRYTNQFGELLATNRETTLYQEIPDG